MVVTVMTHSAGAAECVMLLSTFTYTHVLKLYAIYLQLL